MDPKIFMHDSLYFENKTRLKILELIKINKSFSFILWLYGFITCIRI